MGGAVHPRACGEHVVRLDLHLGRDGSSPRLRGTYLLITYVLTERRFIPAPAGNISGYLMGSYSSAVHPRACGEHPRGDGR